ncbi:Galactoside transport system permease protein mglC [Haemophilus influenzae HK1212]|uniref:Galactoside transport system permease protein mglC n=1 Tax=Haemophilus influenzae HK1212 TaxID=456482 RepID=A0A7G2JXB6_HAEIF|nr:Galactoside transport system permease protein mglC [Haemophilus influenzae HK1212]
MIIIYGFNSLYYDAVGGSPIAGFSENFSTFAQGFFRVGSFKLSYITIYAAIAALLVWIMWNKTRFGKNVFAIGGNPEAAKVSGVNVARNLVAIYMIAGMFYAFGGMLEAGRIGSATNNLGFMYELAKVLACEEFVWLLTTECLRLLNAVLHLLYVALRIPMRILPLDKMAILFTKLPYLQGLLLSMIYIQAVITAICWWKFRKAMEKCGHFPCHFQIPHLCYVLVISVIG